MASQTKPISISKGPDDISIRQSRRRGSRQNGVNRERRYRGDRGRPDGSLCALQPPAQAGATTVYPDPGGLDAPSEGKVGMI